MKCIKVFMHQSIKFTRQHLISQMYEKAAYQGVLMVKNPSANGLAGRKRDIKDTSSIPGLGRSPEGGHSNPLQYSCLENAMDRGAWRAGP